MDYGQLGHAPEELLALQVADGLLSDACLRPAVDRNSDARGQGGTGADAQRQEGAHKAQRLREVDNSFGREREGARQHCEEIPQGADEMD